MGFIHQLITGGAPPCEWKHPVCQAIPALATSKAKINAIAAIGLVENMPGSKKLKDPVT